MSTLTDHLSYADAQRLFSADKLWELFSGNRDKLNIATECVDRHAGSDQLGVVSENGK